MTFIAAAIAAGGTIAGSAIGAFSANSRAKRATREKRRLEAELTELENSRQPVINPYAGLAIFLVLPKILLQG